MASPFLLVIAAAANIALASQPFYFFLLSAHVCFYISAFVGWAFQKMGTQSKCFGAPLMFLALNITTVAALCDAIRGRFTVTWRRTA